MSRYQGGKNGAGVYQTIINCIPWHWRYVEAFAGSAAVFRHKLPARGGSILIERDPEQAERLRQLESPQVTVLQADALNVLTCGLGLGVQDFVYLDPPYHPGARCDPNLYAYELGEDHHHQLLHSTLPALTAAGVKWALSGYRHASYDDAAGAYGWHRKDYTAQTRRGPVVESLWTNFDPAREDLHDTRYLGDDFRERERIARKVRRWANKLQQLPRHERAAIMAALSTTAASGGERST
jgi:DNA adenine methylase